MCAPTALRFDLVDCMGATEPAGGGCTCEEGVGETEDDGGGGGGVDGTASIVAKITR